MTTITTTAADPHAHIWAENARIHALRLALWEWHMDRVGGRTRLVKDVAREHGASDREIMRVYLRVGADLRPNALVYKDLDAYAAAWRDALVKVLHAYRATSDRLFSMLLDRLRNEARFRRWNGGKAAKTHPKARAHRAWRRNAERMQRNWVRSL
jgi:hypothetical protein